MIRLAAALLFCAVAAFCQTTKDVGASGKITDAVTHQPIAGAKVSLQGPPGTSAISDADGQWAFPAEKTAPRPGETSQTEWVMISKSGYVTLGPVRVEVHSGVRVTHDFELSAPASLTGHLLDRETGKPIAAHLVTATLRKPEIGQKIGAASDETSEDGSFTIESLNPGEYTLEIDPSLSDRVHSGVPPDDQPEAQTAWGPAWYPGVPRADMAAPIVLSAGENRAVEVRLPKRQLRRIIGVIEVPEGLQTGRVVLEVQPLGGSHLSLSKHDISAGPFYIDGLDDSAYFIQVSGAGGNQSSPSAGAIVETGDRDIDNLHLTLRAPVEVRTEIKMAEPDAKPPEDFVLLLSSVDGRRQLFMIGPSLPSRSAQIPPGSFIPQIQRLKPGYAISSISYGGRPVDRYMPIDIEASGSVTVTFTSRPGSVTGTVRSFGQNVVPDADIELIPAAVAESLEQADLSTARGRMRMQQIEIDASNEGTAKSDSTGAFRIDDLAPGEYWAIALAADDSQRALGRDPLFVIRDLLRYASKVTVEASKTANLELQIR